MIAKERCWTCRGTGRLKGPLYSEPCPICTPSPCAGSRITEEEADRAWADTSRILAPTPAPEDRRDD